MTTLVKRAVEVVKKKGGPVKAEVRLQVRERAWFCLSNTNTHTHTRTHAPSFHSAAST